MIIERIQVEDGFLNGLDLRLSKGLNVLIGGRGTGKTSVIELIRFCLAVSAQTEEAEARSLEHALAVLGDGRVTITLRNEHGDRNIVTRSAAEDVPEVEEDFESPALFSQKEIESLGLSAAARIALLDSFIQGLDQVLAPKEQLTKRISSCTAEAAALSNEIETLDQQLQQLPAVEKELAAVADEQKMLASRSKEIASKQEALKEVAAKSSQLAVQAAVFVRTSKNVALWMAQLDELIQGTPDIEDWPDSAGGEDKLAKVRRGVELAANSLDKVKASLTGISEEVRARAAEAQKLKLHIDEQIRAARREIEGLEKGAGEIVKRANAIREKLASLKATQKLRDSRVTKRRAVLESRSNLLDEFEELHRRRFGQRQKVASRLNSILGPQIRLEVRQASDYTEYMNAITACLRGSGLKYNDLAPVLASSISPRELVDAVERMDTNFIASACSLPIDRASRLLGWLKTVRLESILTVTVEDDAKFELLDGKDYKEIQDLSVGQRCTVVLPIVLEHADRVLVIDQPEDHLDNAFIVDTFVKALNQKSRPQQMLFSTHNANIPVLGNAQKVFVMQSNGQRGFVDLEGPLEDSPIVRSITNIMEGGREAFEARARFYKEHK